MQELYTQLKEFGQVKTNALMSKVTTFKIGGPVQFLVMVDQTEKLVALLTFLTGEGVPYFILGGGSNLLWQDEAWEGVVIKLETRSVKLEGEEIVAEAGAPFASLVMTAVQNSLAGLEWAAGLPGTVGGAVRGNAGAEDSDTARSLKKIEVWRDGEVMELAPEECGYGYRESAFKHTGDIVLRAWFKTTPGDKAALMQRMQAIIKGRSGRYPAAPSAGSFFKNVSLEKWVSDAALLPKQFLETGKIPAGWINEQNGLKGRREGGAMISEEHGNFLINYKEGTQREVLMLVEEAREKAYSTFQVELEPEVYIKK